MRIEGLESISIRLVDPCVARTRCKGDEEHED